MNASLSLSQLIQNGVLENAISIPNLDLQSVCYHVSQDPQSESSIQDSLISDIDSIVDTSVSSTETSPMTDYEFARAKKELCSILAGRKRRRRECETPTKSKKCYSGPPSVQSSPLTPNRREKLGKIRQVLFCRNLNKALLAQVNQQDSEGQPLVFTSANLLERGNYNFQGASQNEVLIQNQENLEPSKEFLLNKNFQEFHALVEKNPGFLYTTDGEERLNKLIFFACADENEYQLKTLNDQAEEESTETLAAPSTNATDGSKGHVGDDVNLDGAADSSNVQVVFSGRLYANPKTGEKKPAWFEKPALSTEYHNLLQHRELFRYVFLRLANRVRNTVHQHSMSPLVRKVLVKLGYSDEQIKKCHEITRAIANRFKNSTSEKALTQFQWILDNPETQRNIDATIDVLLSDII